MKHALASGGFPLLSLFGWILSNCLDDLLRSIRPVGKGHNKISSARKLSNKKSMHFRRQLSWIAIFLRHNGVTLPNRYRKEGRGFFAMCVYSLKVKSPGAIDRFLQRKTSFQRNMQVCVKVGNRFFEFVGPFHEKRVERCEIQQPGTPCLFLLLPCPPQCDPNRGDRCRSCGDGSRPTDRGRVAEEAPSINRKNAGEERDVEQDQAASNPGRPLDVPLLQRFPATRFHTHPRSRYLCRRKRNVTEPQAA